MPPAVVMGDGLPPLFLELLGPDVEVVPWTTEPSSADARRIVALITYGHPRVDGPLLDRFPNLKVVTNHGVGVDHIDVAACAARRIPVGNTPGCLDASTADMTFALLLAVARNVVVGDHFARGPEFTHYDPAMWIGSEVSGSTLGIVGLGRIGRQVAQRARGFDMRILYHNRHRDTAAERELGVVWCSLDELLAQGDFVSLHCPLTPQTTGLIGEPQLRKMKPSAFLINMARGPVVQTEALLVALRERWIAGAGLDVTDPEPLPRNHPLLGLDNLVIAPHLGSASNRTRRRMIEMSIENLWAGLTTGQLSWSVQP